jgi:hypothetical protein
LFCPFGFLTVFSSLLIVCISFAPSVQCDPNR